MSREIRMVPRGWKHPKDADGRYRGLIGGSYREAVADWEEEKRRWAQGQVEDYSAYPEKKWKKKPSDLASVSFTDWIGPKPRKNEYMPEFPAGTATMLCMYETVSEGTPISPAFATPEKLARWLADNEASAFGDTTATYEQWLATCKRGWAPSAILDRTGLKSGVEALAKSD